MKERVNYFSIPIELIACPFFSEKEKQIITTILRLSDKFITLGGCNLSNKQLAYQHRVNPQIVSNAISKANKLGFVVERSDIIHKKESEIQKNEYSTERVIQMKIPEEWILMGDLYNHAFIYQDEKISKFYKEIEKELKSLPKSEIDQEEVEFIIRNNFDICPPIKNYIGGVISKRLTINKGISFNKGIKKPISCKKKKTPRIRLPLSYDKILSTWNEITNSSPVPSLRSITPGRKKSIQTRTKNLSLTKKDWQDVFRTIEDSDFLNGDNDRGWTITFDWLVKSDENFSKVLEGNFPAKKKPKPKTKSKYAGIETVVNTSNR